MNGATIGTQNETSSRATRPRIAGLGGALIAAGLALSALGAPGAARAQQGTLDRFRAAETPEDDFHLSRPTDLGDLRFALQLNVDYALNPLVYERVAGATDSEAFSIVEHQLVGNLGFALGLADRVVIFAGLPFVMAMDGASAADAAIAGVPPADGPGLSDVYLGARVRIVGDDDDIGALGLQVTGTFPTSAPTPSVYRGEPFLTIHPELLGELRPGAGSRITLNVGARLREETASTSSNLAFTHELTFGLGFAVPVWTDEGDRRTHFDLHAQLYGESSFSNFFGRTGTPLEAIGGLKFFHASGVVAGAAAGLGLNRGFGSPDLRVIGSIAWMMPEEIEPVITDRDEDGILDVDDQCPDNPEDIDGFEDEDGCPDVDNDGDGILDADDECPSEPETVNQFDDADGCPDEIGDRDGDGILDNVDECPDDIEDVDGFEDEDGCPDADNDGDGVTDEADRCPMVPGVVANEGCPDSDRDEDTVPDRIDNCPDEPGTVENHGCAEQQAVVIRETGLEILDRVYFATNRATIQRRSFPLLMNVAQVLNNHPEIAHISIEGHTDSRGRRDRNVRLSQQRADAVMRYLVTRGNVAAERLTATGYGPDRPRVENANDEDGWAQNRRVEFNIPQATETVQQAPDGASPGDAAPGDAPPTEEPAAE